MEKNKENKCNCLPQFWFVLICSILVVIMLDGYYKNRLVPFEIEGSCNSGFIGVDYKSTFDNQPYYKLDRVYDGSVISDFRLVQFRHYHQEYLPQQLNLKNINGLNCNFKVKGAIPANMLQELG